MTVSANFSPSEELANYKAMRVPPAYSNMLEFSKELATAYTQLLCHVSATARRVLCISASSAQSETNFSSVKRTVTDAKSLK